MLIRLDDGRVIEAGEGTTLLDALRSNGIFISASCGGKGACGKCRVRITGGRCETPQTMRLSEDEIQSGMVLACKATLIEGPELSIEIPETSRISVGGQIAVSKAHELEAALLASGAAIETLVKTVTVQLPHPSLGDSVGDMERIRRGLAASGLEAIRFPYSLVIEMSRTLREAAWDVIIGYRYKFDHPEAVFILPNKPHELYGIAVDVGTTSVVVYLVDLQDGRLLDTASVYNSQIRYGDDVITRIVHATETAGERGLGELQRAIVGDINDLTGVLIKRRGIEERQVVTVSLSGNTTMMHLLWGLPPGTIREEPYIPTINAFPKWRASRVGIRINHMGPAYTLPCVASYVGGDIVAGVLATGMHRREEIALFMDIGTNGEVAIGNNEWLVTAACSAGPCFEGSGIRHGMRATEGAIEDIVINPETMIPEIKVIGGGAPRGICGSAMIDAICEMLTSGIIDQKGKFRQDRDIQGVRRGDEGLEYVLFGEGPSAITLTEVDIENIIRAKAAIYAGVSLLITEVGLAMEAIERVYIAGGFGNYLEIRKAIIIGMLPDLPLERFEYRGNTSAAGAYLTLLSASMRAEAEQIASMMTYMELSVSAGFMDEYMSAMFLPHTEAARFPSVQPLLP